MEKMTVNIETPRSEEVSHKNNRSSGNNKKSKKRKKKSSIRFGFYFVNILLAIVIIIILIFILAYFICDCKKVTYQGNSIYSDEEIETIVLDNQFSNNAFYECVYSFVKPVKDVDFINSVKVRMDGLNSVVITVDEKEPFAYFYDSKGQAVYLDVNANVTDVTQRVLTDRVYWKKFVYDKYKIGKELSLKDNEKIVIYKAIAKNLTENNITVNSMLINKKHRSYLFYNDIKITLGNKRNIESKIKRLQFILPELDGKNGTLHLENYSEENTDIVFRYR